MGNFTDAVGDAIRSGLCTYLRADDNANRWFNELSPVDLPNFGRYWRGRLCDEDPTGIPPSGGSFSGGQCEGVLYSIVTQITAENFNTCAVSTDPYPAKQLQGPITGVFGEVPGSNAGCSGLDGFKRIVIRNALGQQVTVTSTIGSDFNFRDPEILSITRVDGQPDVCGDPPVVIPPFPDGGDTFPISVTYQDIDNNQVNLSGTVNIFAPVFAPVTPVTIFAPVRVDLGGIEFSGNIELSPDFNFDFGFPDSEIDIGDGGGDPDETDPDTGTPACTGGTTTTRILGVIVLSTPGPGRKTTEINQDPAPTLYVPRIATAHFCIAGRRARGWDSGNDVKTRAAYLEAPPNAIATDVRVGFEPGWSGRVIPIRVPI